MNFLDESSLLIDQSAIYCIRVGGLEITPSGKEKKAVTTLSGPIIDQAALIGVIKALYDLHFPLLSVECLEVT